MTYDLCNGHLVSLLTWTICTSHCIAYQLDSLLRRTDAKKQPNKAAHFCQKLDQERTVAKPVHNSRQQRPICKYPKCLPICHFTDETYLWQFIGPPARRVASLSNARCFWARRGRPLGIYGDFSVHLSVCLFVCLYLPTRSLCRSNGTAWSRQWLIGNLIDSSWS